MTEIKTIVDVETGEQTERALTKAEKDQAAKDQAEQSVIEAAQQAEAEAKAQAKAELLAKLGITEDEAKLLLG